MTPLRVMLLLLLCALTSGAWASHLPPAAAQSTALPAPHRGWSVGRSPGSKTAVPRVRSVNISQANPTQPQYGRFLVRDPLGWGAGSNVYAYTENSPLNASDPSGLEVKIDPKTSGPRQKVLQQAISTLQSKPAGLALYNTLHSAQGYTFILRDHRLPKDIGLTEILPANFSGAGLKKGTYYINIDVPKAQALEKSVPTEPVYVSVGHEFGHAEQALKQPTAYVNAHTAQDKGQKWQFKTPSGQVRTSDKPREIYPIMRWVVPIMDEHQLAVPSYLR